MTNIKCFSFSVDQFYMAVFRIRVDLVYGIIEIKDRRLELEKHKVNPICIPKSRNSRSADMDNVELKMASLPAKGKLRLSKVKPLPISISKSGGNTNIFGNNFELRKNKDD